MREEVPAMFLDAIHLIADNPPRPCGGVAITDIDGDGAFEAMVAGLGCANPVLKWDGRRLRDLADPVLADPARRSLGLAAADFDGDGREEIYVLDAGTVAGPGR